MTMGKWNQSLVRLPTCMCCTVRKVWCYHGLIEDREVFAKAEGAGGEMARLGDGGLGEEGFVCAAY